MGDIQWIKIVTDVFDDEKIRLIEALPEADTVLIIWFKLLAMAGKCNDRGLIYLTRDIPYNDEMLSTIMRRPINTIRLAITEFEKLGMIILIDSFIQVLNWEKHQNIEGMERIKLLRQARNKRYYDKTKQIEYQEMNENADIKTSDESYQDTLDKSRSDKIREDKKKELPPRLKIPPSVEMVQVYLDRKNIISFRADKFCDHYKSNGWMVGRNKMKDWEAAVRTWQRNNFDKDDKPKELDAYEISKKHGIG